MKNVAKHGFGVFLLVMIVAPVPPSTIIALAVMRVPFVSRNFCPIWLNIVADKVCPIANSKKLIRKIIKK